MSWIAATFASAFFAGITSILAKCGIKTTDSDVVTALRTCVVLVFAWIMAALAGPLSAIGSISGKSWLFWRYRALPLARHGCAPTTPSPQVR